MKTLESGNKVPGGFYFDRTSWQLVTVNGKEGTLPGEKDARYMKVPSLMVLAGAPVLGGAMVLFLPFVGFALFFRHLVTKSKETVAAATAATTPARAAKKS